MANEHHLDGVVSIHDNVVRRLTGIIQVHQTTALKTSALKAALLMVLCEHIESIPGDMKLSLMRILLQDVNSVDNVQVRGKQTVKSGKMSTFIVRS